MSEVAAKAHKFPAGLIVLVSLWVLFCIWMFGDMTSNPGLSGGAGPAPSLYNPHPPDYGAVWVALDLWSLGAALIVGFVGYNPLAWRNGRRLIIGGMAFAIMLGRLSSGLILSFLQTLPIQFAEWILILAIPFVLWFDGILVITIFVGIIGAIFAFFIAIPVMLFNQILQFENAIHIYRYHERGLASYIVRAVYWLRNEPLPETAPDERKGARLATRDEAAEIHNTTKFNPARMGFGHWTGSKDTPFYVSQDRARIGSTGADGTETEKSGPQSRNAAQNPGGRGRAG